MSGTLCLPCEGSLVCRGSPWPSCPELPSPHANTFPLTPLASLSTTARVWPGDEPYHDERAGTHRSVSQDNEDGKADASSARTKALSTPRTVVSSDLANPSPPRGWIYESWRCRFCHRRTEAKRSTRAPFIGTNSASHKSLVTEQENTEYSTKRGPHQRKTHKCIGSVRRRDYWRALCDKCKQSGEVQRQLQQHKLLLVK